MGGGGGTPGGGGGTPASVGTQAGVPLTWSWMGYPPHLDLGWGTPPGPGVPPVSWMGYLPLDLGWGTPPISRMGYPPPLWTDKQTENITSSRTTYAVGKNEFIYAFIFVVSLIPKYGGNYSLSYYHSLSKKANIRTHRVTIRDHC